MQKIRNFTSLLLRSIKNTISTESPGLGSTYENCENWLWFYSNHANCTTINFLQRSTLYICALEKTLHLASLLSIKAYKRYLKDTLLRNQSSGNPSEWKNKNVSVFNIDGLRRSQVTYRKKINYDDKYIFYRAVSTVMWQSTFTIFYWFH